MKHKCPYCEIVFECPLEDCDGNLYHYCSKKCKYMSEKKKNIQVEISEKLFPGGRWH